MTGDLTDRLRGWEHFPLALEAADEIDRLRDGINIYGEMLGKTERERKEAEATIAALLAVPDDLLPTLGPGLADILKARMAAVVGGES